MNALCLCAYENAQKLKKRNQLLKKCEIAEHVLKMKITSPRGGGGGGKVLAYCMTKFQFNPGYAY